MNEYIINIIFILIFFFILKYIKDNNKTLSSLASQEPKTEQEIEQIKQFNEIMKKEKNKIRY